jgi:hypothetical protein
MGARLRLGAALAVVGLAALLASLASRPPHSSAATARVACGVERWTIKTLGDRPLLLPARPTTIRFLVTRPKPVSLPSRRLLFERHIYRVTAAVTLVRPEDDGDFHLVLQDSAGRTMIAESPLRSCDNTATPKRQRQMASARARVRLCSRANVTGVAFFDFYHGQTGVAPNAIELHPILAFRCLTGTVVNGSPVRAGNSRSAVSRRGRLMGRVSGGAGSFSRCGPFVRLLVAAATPAACCAVLPLRAGEGD